MARSLNSLNMTAVLAEKYLSTKSWISPALLPCTEKYAHVIYRALGHRYEVFLYKAVYPLLFITSRQSVRDAAVVALKAAPQFFQNSIFTRNELLDSCRVLSQSTKLLDSQMLGSLAKVLLLSSDLTQTQQLLDVFQATIAQQMREFQQNELRAIHKSPLYGAFHAIDVILQASRHDTSPRFLTQMLTVCLHAIASVKAPVCSDAPEGFTFEDEVGDSHETSDTGPSSQ